ncbi:YheT family hydrolase [Roseiconus lacunae]|uniref:Alpha/beta fold hydrolase n=1 Tax=Roseiconus lacunae TaxID=2605694 RepID=A0ABT7PQI3_9BACT|nr:alpha/beta fold hydrolase [Roseiconus lacunae]MDM4018578.1 alpha/beta fold hydrolase [Roseiconus lacunae]
MDTDPNEPWRAIFPPFHPKPPWYGGYLQTARSRLFRLQERDLSDYRVKSLRMPTSDDTGDVLTADLLSPPEGPRHPWPLIVLLHGLGGTSQSSYIRSCAKTLLSEGHRVLRLNFRGAGNSAERCQSIHHPGRSEDLTHVFDAVRKDPKYSSELNHGVLLVGFSLGGSVLLHFLANEPEGVPISAAITVSAPLDLAATSRELSQLSRRPIERYLLGKMKKEVLRENSCLTDEERVAVRSANSVWQFDERFTSKHCGFETVDEYYAKNSAERVLDQIDVKTYLIYANSDPVVPSETYAKIDWQSNARLQPVIVDDGGHVGFHGRDDDARWHERCIGIVARRSEAANDQPVLGCTNQDGNRRGQNLQVYH